MFPKSPFFKVIEDNSSLLPAVLTALVPDTVSLAVSATVFKADCLKPDR